MQGWRLAGLAATLLAGCNEDAPGMAAEPAEVAPVVPVERALAGVDVPTLDPAAMSEAEIREGLGSGPRCEFRYTAQGEPVLAVATGPDGAPTGAVVKLGGDLVLLDPVDSGAPEGEIRLAAGEARAALRPLAAEAGEADMVFEVGNELRAGYRGFLDCTR